MSGESMLKGATALVTGGAKRLGAACVRVLAGEGTNVCIHYRASGEKAETLAGELRASGITAETVCGDLSDPRGVEKLFEDVVGRVGPVDILVNNASIFQDSTMLDCTVEDVLENISINAMSPFVLARAFAKQGRPGHIINFLDTRVMDYDRTHYAYHLSKRLFHTITRTMALEFAPSIQVNAIAPGLILPPPGKDARYLEELAHTNPLNRFGKVEDIMEALRYLLHSTFVTGQVLYVDGGRHMRGNIYG
jgi:NAD(P)-dependent dehydrogenase (short-subunit alcohol dehydrogenase family)